VHRFSWGLAGDTYGDLGRGDPPPSSDSSHRRAALRKVRSTAAEAGKFTRFGEKGISFLLLGLWLAEEGRRRDKEEGSRLERERWSRRCRQGRGGW
jgi:hypothetical protein